MTSLRAPSPVADRRSAVEGPGRPWSASAALMALLAAFWIQRPSVGLLVAVAVNLAVVLFFTRRAWARAGYRRAGVGFTGLVFVFAAGQWHRDATRSAEDWDTERLARAKASADALAERFGKLGEDLIRDAAAALAAPAASEAAFTTLAILNGEDAGRGIVLERRGRRVAWAGRLQVPLDSLQGPVGIIATPFYLVAYALASEGESVAVATALLHAEPPADALSEPLDRLVATDFGIDGFDYGEAAAAERVADAAVLRLGPVPVLAARARVASKESLTLAALEQAQRRGGLALAVLVLLLIATAWRRDAGLAPRLGALGVGFGTIAIVPLSAFSNASSLFDPTFYYVASGWRFTANAAALAITCALLLVALLSALRARVRPSSRLQATFGVLLVAGIGPFLLRDLARGIQVPTFGVNTGLWLAWEGILFLAAVTVLLVGVTMGQAALGGKRGLQSWVAPALAAVAAFAAPLLLEAPGRFPEWYPVLWISAIAALAVTRRAGAMVAPVALVAACGAVTLTWYSTVRERVELATRDVQGLSVPEPNAGILMQRFTGLLDPASAPTTRVELLARYAASDLAAADFPTEITTWSAAGVPMADLRVGRGPGATYGVNIFAQEVQGQAAPILREVPGEPGVHTVLSFPHADRTVTTVVLAPRTRLVPTDPFSAFLGFAPPPSPEPPYDLRIGEGFEQSTDGLSAAPRWLREQTSLHGDWIVPGVGGAVRRVHAVVELRGFGALVTRGALIVLFDLALLGVLWLLIVIADGAMGRWWRWRRRELWQSYRARLTLALFAMFVLPSALFAVWSYQRLQADDRQSRDLLVRETLRGVASSTDSVRLAEAAARFETPLFLYADGLLIGTSDPALDALAPVGRLLPASIIRALGEGDELSAGREAEVGRSSVRLGYRSATDASGVRFVLAAPARTDERLLDRRRNDLAIFLLFAAALGALAALWASGAAARQLSAPIRALQRGALALASGDRSPELPADPPVEFASVFSAFNQMTRDLAESRSALEAAERRLSATLRNVASGVVAVDEHGMITFSNPPAEALLDRVLRPGASFARSLSEEDPIEESLARFRESTDDDEESEREYHGRRIHVRLTRLAVGTKRVVLTLDDVTEVARAQRVLAWGEMARQVAHEIKNPLTPMRLGMQHLRRARRDPRVDFDVVLEENTTRVLAEIDRLDEIARAFSRYGAAPVDQSPPEPVDIAAIVRDVLELERLGAEAGQWELQAPEGPLWVVARERELRDVVLNLLENARFAGATRVVVALQAVEAGVELRVTDDGEGVAPEILGRIFEPHFSTRTSGSGLGLAVSRRLIEGWGGAISAESVRGSGTTILIRLARSAAF